MSSFSDSINIPSIEFSFSSIVVPKSSNLSIFKSSDASIIKEP